METTIVLALALAVVLGSAMVSWGVRQFHLSSGVLAVAFTITAVSWLALIVTAIGFTVKQLALAPL
jgi:hypothetical protein